MEACFPLKHLANHVARTATSPPDEVNLNMRYANQWGCIDFKQVLDTHHLVLPLRRCPQLEVKRQDQNKPLPIYHPLREQITSWTRVTSYLDY